MHPPALFGLLLLALVPSAGFSIDSEASMLREEPAIFRLHSVGPQNPTGVSPSPAAAPGLSRERLVRRVLDRNPSLKAIREIWIEAQNQVPQAAALPDPDTFYSLAPLSIGAGEARFGQILSVSQTLPFPGTLRHKGDVARAEAAMARHNYDTLRLELATLASQLYDDYAFVFKALEVNSEHSSLVEEIKQVATSRYSAGLVSQQDPIQAEVELAHLEHREMVLQSARATLGARLNALLHLPPESALPRPVTNPVPPRFDLDTVELQQEAVDSRPELQERRAQIDAARATIELRRLDRYPGFQARTSFNSMWAASQHRWVVGVGLNFPIQRRKIRAGIAQAEARRRQAEYLRDSLEDNIRAQVQQACVRLLEAHHVVRLYKSRLLPASKDQIQAALAGFKTSRNSFLALIDAERNLRTVEIEYQGAISEFHRRSADLDRAVGRLPAGVPDRTLESSGTLSSFRRKGDSR